MAVPVLFQQPDDLEAELGIQEMTDEQVDKFLAGLLEKLLAANTKEARDLYEKLHCIRRILLTRRISVRPLVTLQSSITEVKRQFWQPDNAERKNMAQIINLLKTCPGAFENAIDAQPDGSVKHTTSLVIQPVNAPAVRAHLATLQPRKPR
jgi:hypothetical protein